MTIEIANKLVQLRKKSGLSQDELASKLGISRQAVSKWERAEASPDTDNLICLAKIYGVSLDELLYSEDSVETIANDKLLEQSKEDIDEDSIVQNNKKYKILNAIFSGTFMLIAVVAYITWGSIYSPAWAYGWVLMLIPIVLSSIVDVIFYKRPSKFNMPVFCVIVYMFIGFLNNLWHPGWLVFLIIPIYYSFCSLFGDKDED